MSVVLGNRRLVPSATFLALLLAFHGGHVIANERPVWLPAAQSVLDELDSTDAEPCSNSSAREFVLIGETNRPLVLSAERDLQRQFNISRTRVVVEGRGCGRAPRTFALNLVRVPSRAEPFIQVVPPPPSEIDGFLYPDVYKSVFIARLTRLHRGCEKASIQSVEALGGEPWKIGASWKERWTYSACGTMDKAEIEFTYDGNGATFRSTVPGAPSGN